MSLIGIEIQELRNMHKQLIDGKLSPKECHMRLKIYKATADRERMILDMYKLSTLKGLSMGKFANTGLFSDDELLPACLDSEQLDCPEMERVISRSECLDYSGENKNYEACSTCPNFSSTRKKL